MDHNIAVTGLTVGYEPSEGQAVVDIVFVHGLQGHPYRTWASTNPRSLLDTGARPPPSFSRMLSSLATKPAHAETHSPSDELPPDIIGERLGPQFRSVFWPVDLLPKECPNSRVLLYGYDTKITRFTAGAPDRGSTFSQGKDLLFALDRMRTPGRRLIFLAHSLGGIVVKEMLSSSDAAAESRLKDIVSSTAAVLFLGTPHRGSTELVHFAEWARLVVSSLRLESSWAIMDVLGLKTTDLERTQEAFSRLWRTYDFQVKTFQEGMGLTGFKFGNMGNKVVPDHSSLIGDPRERAETIRANHKDMCRFTQSDDPNYRRVVGELKAVYLSIRDLNSQGAGPKVPAHRDKPVLPRKRSAATALLPRDGIHSRLAQQDYLRKLYFPNMGERYQEVDRPAEGTCRWIFERREPQRPSDTEFKSFGFQNWVPGDLKNIRESFLWIKGRPGSGKSVLMKEAHRRISAAGAEGGLGSYCTATFFFNAKGDKLACSRMGFFRSLLYQLLPHHPEYFEQLTAKWNEGRLGWDMRAFMREAELKDALLEMFTHKSSKKSYIFIDALDECGARDDTRYLSELLYAMVLSAHRIGVNLRVCVSSRHFPTVGMLGPSEVALDHYNGPDVRSYVEGKIHKGISTAENRQRLIDTIDRKCNGIFLWAALVIDDVLRMWDEGRNMIYIVNHLDRLPKQLDWLYTDILASMGKEERRLATSLFHWAILATKPLRLREWHHIMAFIKRPVPLSLREWCLSEEYTEDDEQLIKQIRYVSRGLVEVRSRPDEAVNDAPDPSSVRAGAGSLSLSSGETRVVQVIHESVREFFLQRTNDTVSFERAGHISIMMTCLDYLNIAELDELVQARIEVGRSVKSDPGTKCGIEPLVDWETNREPLIPPFSYRRGVILHTRIMEWLRTVTPASRPPSPQVSQPDTPPSTDEQTHVLEAYPALLTYATCEVFSHVELAEVCGADSMSVARRFLEPAVWDRWVALREDIPLGTTPLQHVKGHRLNSWLPVALEMAFGKDFTKNSRVSPSEMKTQKPREDGSVASFGSAGSSPASAAMD